MLCKQKSSLQALIILKHYILFMTKIMQSIPCTNSLATMNEKKPKQTP